MSKATILILAALCVSLSTAKIAPLPEFEVGLLAQGSGGIYVDWYLQSVYDPTGRNWNEIACAVTGFLYGDTFGIMVNFSTALTASQGFIREEEKIYYDMNNQSVFYKDEAKTQLAFFVANFSFTFIEGEEVDLVIIAVPAGDDYVLLAYAPLFVVGRWHYDITSFLKSNNINPVLNSNYFHPEDYCFYSSPSTAQLVFKNPDQILGDHWYVTAVSDTRKHFDWRSSQCSYMSFSKNTTSNLYLMNVTVGSVNDGPYEFINDPQNVTLFVGYYFSDWATANDLILEVFYADLFGNYGVINQDTCWAAIISKKNKPISNTIFAAFQLYLNTYAPKFCFGYQKQDPITLTNTGCASDNNSDLKFLNA